MDETFGSWIEEDAPGDAETIRILHVEDDSEFADLAKTMLERQSDAFEVLTEHSAAGGLDRVSDDIDCIVSDYQMPGQTGLDFFETLPPEYADIPFILFTGRGSEEVASKAFSADVTDYVQKEIGADQFTVLAHRIEQAVAQARSHKRLERAHRRFKTLVEESTDAILVVSDDGTIRYATPATEAILGRSPEELVGTNGFDPLHPDDVSAVSAELDRLLQDPDSRAVVECRYRHADGSWIWIEVRGRNLLDNEDITGIVVYVRDIDDRSRGDQADPAPSNDNRREREI